MRLGTARLRVSHESRYKKIPCKRPLDLALHSDLDGLGRTDADAVVIHEIHDRCALFKKLSTRDGTNGMACAVVLTHNGGDQVTSFDGNRRFGDDDFIPGCARRYRGRPLRTSCKSA